MESISRHRGELMGIATLAVVIHHVYTGLRVPLMPVVPYLGYSGVDIFLFLSGFGLCFGYGKYKSVSQFYHRRFSRIFPTYLTVIIIGAIFLYSYSLLDVLIMSTGIGYYLPVWGVYSFDWYVPAIYGFYLLFPVIYNLINKNIKWGVVIFICSFIPFLLKIAGFCHNYGFLALPRIPIFVVGVIAGVLYNKSRKNNTPSLSPAVRIILEIAAVVGFIAYIFIMNGFTYRFLVDSMLAWYPLIIIIPGFCLLASRILDKMPESICVVLSFIGGISLEIYLLQALWLLRCGEFVTNCEMLSTPSMHWLAGFVFVIFSIVAGYILSMFMKFATWGYNQIKAKVSGNQ